MYSLVLAPAHQKEMYRMFQNQDFWIGLGVGVLAGIFGYKLMVEREQQLLALQQPAQARRLTFPWQNYSVRKKNWKT